MGKPSGGFTTRTIWVGLQADEAVRLFAQAADDAGGAWLMGWSGGAALVQPDAGQQEQEEDEL